MTTLEDVVRVLPQPLVGRPRACDCCGETRPAGLLYRRIVPIGDLFDAEPFAFLRLVTHCGDSPACLDLADDEAHWRSSVITWEDFDARWEVRDA